MGRRSKQLVQQRLDSQQPQDNKRRLFIDPASISTGWAYFIGSELKSHGTIAVPQKLDVFTRLHQIWLQYVSTIVQGSLDEVHIELLPKRCHHYTHWSVGVIGAALMWSGWQDSLIIKGDIPVKAWQKAVDWNGKRAIIKKSALHEVASEDEEAAIGMGLYYIRTVLCQ